MAFLLLQLIYMIVDVSIFTVNFCRKRCMEKPQFLDYESSDEEEDRHFVECMMGLDPKRV